MFCVDQIMNTEQSLIILVIGCICWAMRCCPSVNTVDRVCYIRIPNPGHYLVVENTANLDGSACIRLIKRAFLQEWRGLQLTGKSKIEKHLRLVIACCITRPKVSAPSRCERAMNLLAPRPIQSSPLIGVGKTRSALIPRVP